MYENSVHPIGVILFTKTYHPSTTLYTDMVSSVYLNLQIIALSYSVRAEILVYSVALFGRNRT